MIIFIIFLFYQIIQIISLPFFVSYLLLRKAKGKTVFGNLKERIGLVPKAPKNNPVFWFHAVSVGEVLSLQAIIEKIKNENKNSICYITVGTSTGKKIARENTKADYISFLPYDFLISMLIAYNRIGPTKLTIVEAELWPNLLIIAKLKKIKLNLINARISKRSKHKYKKLKLVISPLINLFEKIYTQSEYDKKEFLSLGIKKEKLIVLGDIKAYNVLKKRNQTKNHIESNKKPHNTLLVGSMHPGELKIYLNLLNELRKKDRTIKLIIAPRHFHWKETLIKKIKEENYSFAMWDENEIPFKKNTNQSNSKSFSEDILLVCKLGELFSLYKEATIYFLGGTFVPIGGHNLLEPAAWGVPTIIGPHHQNCYTTAKELLNKNALIKVTNEKDLLKQTAFLLEHPFERNTIGANSKAWLEDEGERIENLLTRGTSAL